MSVSAEAFHLIRSKWEQREQASKRAQLETMLQANRRQQQQQRKSDKENQYVLLRGEPPQTAPPQQPGRLRRLSSLQAITNFTKDAFNRRKSSKLHDSPSSSFRTPSMSMRPSSPPNNKATPTAYLDPNYRTPVTAFRHGPSTLRTGEPQSTQKMKMARSKTTSFLPVASKMPPPLPSIPGNPTTSRSRQQFSRSTGARLTSENTKPGTTTGVSSSSLLTERPRPQHHSLSTNLHQSARSQPHLYQPRRDSYLPPKLPNASFWQDLDNLNKTPELDLRLRLPRSTTQPNFAGSKHHASTPSQESETLRPNFPPRNIFRVERNMPLEYWAGRFSSLRDQVRSMELSGELPTNGAMTMPGEESPGLRITGEERMVRDVLTVMYMSCDNEGATGNLKVSGLFVL